MKYWLYGTCCLALGGCQTFMPSSRVVRLPSDDGYVVMHQAAGRSAYMVDRSGRSFICSEPVPDVGLNSAFTTKGKGSSTAPQTPVSVEAEAGETTTVVALSGRTENVLLLRDMLYYACLYNANGSFSDDQVFDAYAMTIQAIEKIASAEQSKAAAGFVAAAGAAGVSPREITAAVQNLTAPTSTNSEVSITRRSAIRHDIQAILCAETPANTAAVGQLRSAAASQNYGWIAAQTRAEVSGHPGFHKAGVTLYYDAEDGDRAVADALAAELQAQGVAVQVAPNIGRSRWVVSASVCMAGVTPKS